MTGIYDKGNSHCQIDLCYFCVVGYLRKTLLDLTISLITLVLNVLSNKVKLLTNNIKLVM